MKTTTKRKIFLGVISFLILFTPFFIRVYFENSTPLGFNSYESILRTNLFLETPTIIGVDNNIFPERAYIFNLYDLILAGSSKVIGLDFSATIFPLIFGVLTVLLVYNFLKKMSIRKPFYTVLIFIVSPFFFYTFSTSNITGAAIFFNFLAFNLILSNKLIFRIISFILFCLMPFFWVYHYLISISFLLYLQFRRRISKEIIYYILSSLLIAIIFYSYIIYNLGFPIFNFTLNQSIFTFMISDLGADGGLGIFAIFLGVLGLIFSWKYKKKYLFTYFSFIFFLILAIANPAMFTYFGLPISFFSAYALAIINKRNWKLPYIKDFTLLLIICGFLFSQISYASSFIDKGPSYDEIQIIKSINGTGNVFSSYHNGFLIESTITNKAIVDNKFDHFYDNSQKINDTRIIFNSRNLERTTNLLKKYNVSHILIDDQMKDQIWLKKSDGLLFLFRNNETFKNIYKDTSIEIWKLNLKETEKNN